MGLLPAFAGCGSALADLNGGTALVRFVAVAQGIPSTDFYVNGTGAAYGLDYESFTSYLPVGTGGASLAVRRNGATQPMVEAQGTLLSGHQYTVLLGPGGGAAQERLYTDREEPASAGQIALRILNAVEPGSINSFTVAPLAAGESASPVQVISLNPGEASAYLALPAGAYVVTAARSGSTLHIPVATLAVKGRSGAVRTVVFAGAPSGEAHRGVIAFTLADADSPEPPR